MNRPASAAAAGIVLWAPPCPTRPWWACRWPSWPTRQSSALCEQTCRLLHQSTGPAAWVALEWRGGPCPEHATPLTCHAALRTCFGGAVRAAGHAGCSWARRRAHKGVLVRRQLAGSCSKRDGAASAVGWRRGTTCKPAGLPQTLCTPPPPLQSIPVQSNTLSPPTKYTATPSLPVAHPALPCLLPTAPSPASSSTSCSMGTKRESANSCSSSPASRSCRGAAAHGSHACIWVLQRPGPAAPCMLITANPA